MKTMICGANGQVASKVINKLENEGLELVLTTSSVLKDKKVYKHTTVTLDYFNQKLQPELFAGIDNILIVWPSNLIKYNSKFDHFLNCVFNSDIKHIVFISAMGMEYAYSSPYYKIEKMIKKSNKSHTILRPNMYMQNIITHHGVELQNLQQLCMSQKNIKISYIDIDDVAKVIVEIFKNTSKYQNKILELTGNELLTNEKIVETINEVCNLNIQLKIMSKKEFINLKQQQNFSKEVIKELTTLYFYAKLGFMKKITPTLSEILQNNTNSFETFVLNNKNEFIKKD